VTRTDEKQSIAPQGRAEPAIFRPAPADSPQGPLVRASWAAAELVLVSAMATALYAYLTWPLVLHFGSRIFGSGGDASGTIAWFWELRREGGYHILGSYHVDLVGAPFGWVQGSAGNLQIAVPAFPAYQLSKVVGDIAAYNLVVASGLVLSFVAMYALVRRVGAARSVALWSALVYVVFPWHLEKAQGHAAFVHLEGFPLLLLAVIAWRQRPDFKRVLGIAAAAAVLWTTAGYFGVIASIALAVLLPVGALYQRRAGSARAQSLAIAGGAVVTVAAVMYGLTRAAAGETGLAPARNVSELATYGAHWWEYIVPSYRNIVFGDSVGPWLLGRLHGSNFSETSLYVGWTTIVLAVAWLVWSTVSRRRLSEEQRFLRAGLSLLVGAGIVFSLPSPLPHTHVAMPSRLVWTLVPQFRVPSRFVVLVMTGLVVLAALGLELIRQRLVRMGSPPIGVVLAAGLVTLVGAASFLELSTVPPATVTDLRRPPPEYAAVRAGPPGAVAEYPLVSSDQALNSEYLLRQRLYGRPLVNGAPLASFADAVRSVVVDPSAPGVASMLAALGVSTIVVHEGFYPAVGAPTPPSALRKGYRLLRRFSDGASVWEVTAAPAPAFGVFGAGFGFSEPTSGQPTARWMGSSRGTVEVVAHRAGRYTIAFQVTSYARPRRLQLNGPGGSRSFVVPTGGRTVSFRLRLPRGRSRIRVATSPGPELIPDGRMVTLYVKNWQFRLQAARNASAHAPVSGRVS
jgi:hypothetical protein